jgi:hypothetical protein
MAEVDYGKGRDLSAIWEFRKKQKASKHNPRKPEEQTLSKIHQPLSRQISKPARR